MFIVVRKDSVNQVGLNLKANTTLPSPYYLFQFINDYNENNQVLFNATDISNYSCRSSHFQIIETGTTSVVLSAATINLQPSLSWTFNIYEASALTLSISGTTGKIINTGKVIVLGDEQTINSIYL